MTDKQRIEILEKVKERITNRTETYICNAIKRLTSLDEDVFLLFPELSKHKPNERWHAWFSGDEIKPRLKILNSMITEIKSKSND